MKDFATVVLKELESIHADIQSHHEQQSTLLRPCPVCDVHIERLRQLCMVVEQATIDTQDNLPAC